jgi:hypothetical protein
MVELEQRRIHLEPAQVDPGGLWATGRSVYLSGKPTNLGEGFSSLLPFSVLELNDA